MGADVDRDRAGGKDSNLRRFDQRYAAGRGRGGCARPEAADLDPARQSNAEVLALLASFLLLLAKGFVTRNLHRHVERLLIGARVEDQAEVVGVRKGRDEVLATKLRRIHLQLTREQIDR